MELFEDLILGWLLGCLFVELDDVRNHLGVLTARILGNTALLDEALPLFRKTLQGQSMSC